MNSPKMDRVGASEDEPSVWGRKEESESLHDNDSNIADVDDQNDTVENESQHIEMEILGKDATDLDATMTVESKRTVEKAREPWERLIFPFAMYTLTGMDMFFFAVYYVELVHYFNVPTAEIGWPGSLHQGSTFFFGILVSAPIKLYGARPVAMIGGVFAATGIVASAFANGVPALSFTYGIVTGLGESMIFQSTTVYIHQNFHKNRALATGIAMCGFNVGHVFGSLWVSFLLETYGWRGGFLLHGGLMLQSLVLATQYHPRGKELLPEKKGFWAIIKGSADFSLFKNPSFIVICIGLFGHKTCQFAGWAVVPNSVVAHGGTTREAALVLSIFGGAMFVSRLLGGFLSNLQCVNRKAVLGITVMASGAVLMVLAFFKSFRSAAICAVLYGLNIGAANTLVSVVLVEIFGVDKIARSSGLAYSFLGLSTFAGAPFAGWLFDITGQYMTTFLVLGALGVFGGIMYLSVFLTERCKKSKLESNREL